jgi:tetratricopeptide (TPR) repeat protein
MAVCAATAGAGIVWAHAGPAPGDTWKVARSAHFEIYTQTDSDAVGPAIAWFEQLWAFFEQTGLPSKDPPQPMRVIVFSSRREFDSYMPRTGADAYYIGTEARNYIVLPGLGAAEFITGAHEYTHARLHASGWKLPPWLSEGLADFFSTVHISERESDLGGDLPMRMDVLRHNRRMEIYELLAAPSPSGRPRDHSTALFYAQSWALTEMLALSDRYRSKFWELVNKLGSGAGSVEGLQEVYSKTPSQVEDDLRKWIDGGRLQPLRLPGVANRRVAITTESISAVQGDLLFADLAAAAGELNRARGRYEELLREAPSTPEAWAALGTIALREGDRWQARSNWERAIAHGLKDAGICYRYAELEEEAGADANELRQVLQRAVEIEPGFEDARYKLALLESNAGNYEAALVQLQAMHGVSGARAYGYWMATAYALEELGRCGEAKQAAEKALESTNSDDERARARQLAYMCETDLTVQLARDEKGQLRVMTTRVPHGEINWNPFIEPGDRMQRVEGRLAEIRCDGGKATGIVVSLETGALQISIPDPSQVEMRNAPAEFTCGPQAGARVSVDYATAAKADAAAAGIARGIEFQ